MKQSVSPIINFVAALVLGLAVSFLFDYLDVSALSTPLCLAVAIMGFSLRQSPTFVIAVSIAYISLVIYSAFYVLLYSSHPHVLPMSFRLFALVERLGVFSVVCALAIYLSFYRSASERMLIGLQNTLSNLPVPVVMSDLNGHIVFTNDALNTSLNKSSLDLVGKRYLQFFMPVGYEGKAMQSYFKLFEEEARVIHEIDILPVGARIPMVARITCHGVASNRILITVFLPPDSSLRPVLKQNGHRHL